jgi:uncharacterized OB-fold protein
VRQSGDAFFKSKVPYAVAMVQLDDGPLVMSNIVECEVDRIKIGMRVVATFEAAAEQLTIPMFKPAAGAV